MAENATQNATQNGVSLPLLQNASEYRLLYNYVRAVRELCSKTGEFYNAIRTQNPEVESRLDSRISTINDIIYENSALVGLAGVKRSDIERLSNYASQVAQAENHDRTSKVPSLEAVNNIKADYDKAMSDRYSQSEANYENSRGNVKQARKENTKKGWKVASRVLLGALGVGLSMVLVGAFGACVYGVVAAAAASTLGVAGAFAIVGLGISVVAGRWIIKGLGAMFSKIRQSLKNARQEKKAAKAALKQAKRERKQHKKNYLKNQYAMSYDNESENIIPYPGREGTASAVRVANMSSDMINATELGRIRQQEQVRNAAYEAQRQVDEEQRRVEEEQRRAAEEQRQAVEAIQNSKDPNPTPTGIVVDEARRKTPAGSENKSPVSANKGAEQEAVASTGAGTGTNKMTTSGFANAYPEIAPIIEKSYITNFKSGVSHNGPVIEKEERVKARQKMIENVKVTLKMAGISENKYDVESAVQKYLDARGVKISDESEKQTASEIDDGKKGPVSKKDTGKKAETPVAEKKDAGKKAETPVAEKIDTKKKIDDRIKANKEQIAVIEKQAEKEDAKHKAEALRDIEELKRKNAELNGQKRKIQEAEEIEAYFKNVPEKPPIYTDRRKKPEEGKEPVAQPVAPAKPAEKEEPVVKPVAPAKPAEKEEPVAPAEPKGKEEATETAESVVVRNVPADEEEWNEIYAKADQINVDRAEIDKMRENGANLQSVVDTLNMIYNSSEKAKAPSEDEELGK